MLYYKMSLLFSAYQVKVKFPSITGSYLWVRYRITEKTPFLRPERQGLAEPEAEAGIQKALPASHCPPHPPASTK